MLQILCCFYHFGCLSIYSTLSVQHSSKSCKKCNISCHILSISISSDYFSGSAGLWCALVTPERRILSWEGAGETERSSKSLLSSAFTRVASGSKLAQHSKNLWELRLTPLQTLTHPHSHEPRGLGSTSRATSDEKPSKEEREKTPARFTPLTNQRALDLKWRPFNSHAQERERQLHFT